MEEYIVTLRSKEALEDFYDDMETPGGSLYIPDRAVDLELRRSISRNTHYMLTAEEAAEISKDERVLNVVAKSVESSLPPLKLRGWSRNGLWARGNYFSGDGTTGSTSDSNWGLRRSTLKENTTGNSSGPWGSGTGGTQDPFVVQTVSTTASGKNVDIVIVDGGITTTFSGHPELAVNDDGTGGSRFQTFNWYSNTAALGFGANGTYDYSTQNTQPGESEHGLHVAGIAAGNYFGWARDANIYNIEYPGPGRVNTTHSQTTLFDYIRYWHNTKPINPDTGRRNPTITNHSYGGENSKTQLVDNSGGAIGGIVKITYRGVTLDTTGSRFITDQELRDRGMYVDGSGEWVIGPEKSSNVAFYQTRAADTEDAIEDGIHVITAAGNFAFRGVEFGDQDYDNSLQLGTPSFAIDSEVYYYARANGAVGNGSPNTAGNAPLDVINVGSLDHTGSDSKASYSARGQGVHVFAPGGGIISAVESGSGVYATDTRNASYFRGTRTGTSMSAPQVAGVIAMLVESNPNMTPGEVKQWIINNATAGEMDDPVGTISDPLTLVDAPNKMLYWENQRAETGPTFPKKNANVRPTSGRTYPRPRIRARG